MEEVDFESFKDLCDKELVKILFKLNSKDLKGEILKRNGGDEVNDRLRKVQLMEELFVMIKSNSYRSAIDKRVYDDWMGERYDKVVSSKELELLSDERCEWSKSQLSSLLKLFYVLKKRMGKTKEEMLSKLIILESFMHLSNLPFNPSIVWEAALLVYNDSTKPDNGVGPIAWRYYELCISGSAEHEVPEGDIRNRFYYTCNELAKEEFFRSFSKGCPEALCDYWSGEDGPLGKYWSSRAKDFGL